MASVNKWIGIGNLGRDPEIRYAASGDPIANISMACSDSYKDKATGERKEVTEWVRLVFFGKLAGICEQYLKKGSQIYVEGKLRTTKWTDKNGVDKYTTEIVCDKMTMLGGKQDGGQSQSRSSREAPDDFNDDIPF